MEAQAANCRKLNDIDARDTVSTLKAIASSLDETAAKIDEGVRINEDTFIESYGALLACTIKEALGGTFTKAPDSGPVLLAFDSFGVFYPFEALRASLDADEPSDALREAVAHVEASAAGQTDLARVMNELDKQISKLDNYHYLRHDHTTAFFSNELEIKISHLLRSCENETHEVITHAVQQIVNMVKGAGAAHVDWESEADKVFPRLVSLDFATQMRERDLLFLDFEHDLKLAFIVRSGKLVRYLRRDESAGMSEGAVKSLACRNLEAQSASLRVQPYVGIAMRDNGESSESSASIPSVFQLTMGDGLDASRLCLDKLATKLEERFGTGCVAAIPHRDALLVAKAADVEALKSAAKDAFARAPHRLSKHIFRLSDENGELHLRRMS